MFCNGEGVYALAAVEKQQQQTETDSTKDFSKQLFPKLEPLLSVAALSIKSGT